MSQQDDSSADWFEAIKQDSTSKASIKKQDFEDSGDQRKDDSDATNPARFVDLDDDEKSSTHSNSAKPDPTEQTSGSSSRYEEVIRRKSLKVEKADVHVMMEFSSIIAKVNEAGKTITKIRDQYPDEIPTHLSNGIRDNIKETATVMLKEFQAMRHGRTQKKYDKKYVCKKCHSVFMVPLGKEGICDECKASQTSSSAPY